MGLSGSKTTTTSTQTNKPIYGAQIEGAAKSQQAAYNRQLPAINQFSDNMMDLSGDLLGKYNAGGDRSVRAANRYVTQTLNSDPTNNPYLDDMIAISNDNVRNDLQAKMGTRGLTGGSAYYDMIGRGLAQNETGLRYNDYNNAMDRKQQAAGMASSVAAGKYLPLSAAMAAGQQGAMLPLQASLANSAGVGGLLGQYQTVNGTQTQKQSGGLLGGLLGSVLSGWASGGFAGI